MLAEDFITSVRAIAHNVGGFLNYHLENQQPSKYGSSNSKVK